MCLEIKAAYDILTQIAYILIYLASYIDPIYHMHFTLQKVINYHDVAHMTDLTAPIHSSV